MKEFNVALLGQQASSDDVAVKRADLAEWNLRGIEQLKESCRYLITQRGFEEWKL